MKYKLQRMIEVIENEAKYTRSFTGKDKFDPAVMDAMGKIPRDEFVPDDLKSAAFDDCPLPIGHGQTISQPYMVALMTDLLQIEPENAVLEVGTGSGYQTAVLSLLCKKVCTIELVAALGEAASKRLKKLGYENIESRIGNGYAGWPEHAPYDGIIVTAAAEYVPEALIEQLKPGGRLVIPVGRPYMHQELLLMEKGAQGEISSKSIIGVSFVPLIEEQPTRPGNETLH